MNLFALPPALPAEELTETLHEANGVRIERIISTGQTSGWYDQAETEFVTLLQGTARIAYETSSEVTLQAGDTLLIPPHMRHRVSFTSAHPPCIWLCIFYST